MVYMEQTINLVDLALQALYHVNTKTEMTSVEFTQLVNYGVSVCDAYKQVGIEASLQHFKEGLENIKENDSFCVENIEGAVHISLSPSISLEDIQENELFSSEIALQNLGIKPKHREEMLLQKKD